MQRLAAAIVWGALLCGVAGAAVALGTRGSEEAFRYEQSRSLALRPVTALSAAHVQAVVALAPEPVLAARRTRPARVLCHSGATGVLRNPWSCTIRYRSGRVVRYRVTVQPDGRYSGTGPGIISGCCVKTSTLE